MPSARLHRLRGPLLVGLAVAFLSGGDVASAAKAQRCPTAGTAATSDGLARAARAMRCLVNAERERHGLPPVRNSRHLQQAAARHSRAMLLGATFDHQVPGEAALDARIEATGYLRHATRWWLGETIAYGQGARSSPAALMNSLMTSAPHRAIILDRRFKELGVGLLSGTPMAGGQDTGGATLTLDFGRIHTR